MTFPPKVKPLTQFPQSGNLSQQERQAMDQLVTAINQLIGQANAPQGSGLQAFGPNIINPTTNQISTGGNRTGSVTTSIAFTTTTTSASFFWDGSNGSVPFTIYRDDGSITGPTIVGSGLTVTGLSPNTKYFFYPYWDESANQIKFAIIPGVGIGAPAMAFTSFSIQAAQIQILRGHIPLAPSLSSTGLTTPAAGTGSGSGGGGGGAGGGLNCPLSGAPVKLYGDPAWWTKEIKPQETFLEIITDSGRTGTFSPSHLMYSRRGLLPLSIWETGDWALTEQGEERVISLKYRKIPGATVDRYEATNGHIYSAWGFISHNFKP